MCLQCYCFFHCSNLLKAASIRSKKRAYGDIKNTEEAHTFLPQLLTACTHNTQILGLKCLCTEERGKEVSEACPKGTIRLILWQISDFTRKFLEAINRKWLSKSRWSILTAGTTQEIAERLNGCKKKKMLFCSVLGNHNTFTPPPPPRPPSLPLSS